MSNEERDTGKHLEFGAEDVKAKGNLFGAMILGVIAVAVIIVLIKIKVWGA